jgi:SAM-dependent methyltransferase
MPSDPKNFISKIFSTNHRVLLEKHLKYDLRKLRGTALILGAGYDPYRYLLDKTTNIITNDIDHTLPNIDLVSPADQLDVADCSIDAIVAVEVLEHVPNIIEVLKECERVLCTDGVLYVTMPFMYHIHGDPDDFRRLTLPGLCALLESDFCVQKAQYYGNLTTIILDSLSSCHPALRLLRPIFRIGSIFRYSSNKFPSGLIIVARKK